MSQVCISIGCLYLFTPFFYWSLRQLDIACLLDPHPWDIFFFSPNEFALLIIDSHRILTSCTGHNAFITICLFLLPLLDRKSKRKPWPCLLCSTHIAQGVVHVINSQICNKLLLCKTKHNFLFYKSVEDYWAVVHI